MEFVHQFLAHPQADIVLLLTGIILSLVGFIQVVRKGFALVFWLILFGIGLFPLVYVFKGSDADFLDQARTQVSDIGSLVPGIRDDVLKVWCDKLDSAGQ